MTNSKELLNEMFGKESRSMLYVDVYHICEKLQELGVENIELFPDKIEFEWLDHICTYKNGKFYRGTQGIKPCDDIYKLDSNFLDDLVGKLTDEQLTRVGYIIDLFEDKYNNLLCQQENMEYLGMTGTKLFWNTIQNLSDSVNMIVELQDVFQSGFFDLEESIHPDIVYYILKGE